MKKGEVILIMFLLVSFVLIVFICGELGDLSLIRE